ASSHRRGGRPSPYPSLDCEAREVPDRLVAGAAVTRARRPCPAFPGFPRPLDLTQEEAFLLSQVDALLDEHDLALVSGMAPAAVSAALDRLVRLGVVEIVEAGARAPS